MNKVYLIGNLTRDPELSETPSGIALCRFSIAVNRTIQVVTGSVKLISSTSPFGELKQKTAEDILKRVVRLQSWVAYKTALTRIRTVISAR
jgi:hypothetical protein